jgi:hypothetical protein
MKRQFITYTLAAFCATAILSCNKEAAVDTIGPDTERTVLLTATIDAPTKAVTIDQSKVVCTWEVGEHVSLVYDNTVISTLEVISVDGNKAQLSGKVKGAYNVNTQMYLYYGGISYDYSGQDGTAASAVSKAYLQAETKIISQDGKKLTLQSVTMEHQQAYMGLSFYIGAAPVKVKSVVITDGGSSIVKTHSLDGSETTYSTDPDPDLFTVSATAAEGQEVFFFALRDNNSEDHVYKLKITIPSDPTVYTGTVAAPTAVGNYFADSKVILERLSPVITAPAVYSHITYDGLPHDLITPAVVRPGAIAYYCVSASAPADDYLGWSESIPREISIGTYKVWYKVSGGPDYENILPTKVGTVTIAAIP